LAAEELASDPPTGGEDVHGEPAVCRVFGFSVVRSRGARKTARRKVAVAVMVTTVTVSSAAPSHTYRKLPGSTRPQDTNASVAVRTSGDRAAAQTLLMAGFAL
jgi:hypothetical protein